MSENPGNLNTWHATVLEVEFDPYLSNEYPHRYLLLVNDESLLSSYVRIPDVISLEILLEELPHYFSQCFKKNRFTKNQVLFLQMQYKEIHFTEAKNKSKIGFLRSYSMNYSDEIRRKHYVQLDDEIERRFELNSMRRNRLNKLTPAKAVKNIVSQAK